MTMIQGEKVTLRPYRMSDAEALLRSMDDTEINRLTGTHQTFTLEQIQRYIENFENADDRVGFIIADPQSDDLDPLGEIVIMDIDTNNRSASIRIAMYSIERVNRGYGTEGMRLALNYGFTELNLHRISLEVYAFNPRAIHVYEKIGFKREGVLRDALFYEGAFHDAIMMAILEDEWQPL